VLIFNFISIEFEKLYIVSFLIWYYR